MIFPRLYAVLGMSYMMPMGLYEVGLGLWLLIKGIRQPATHSDPYEQIVAFAFTLTRGANE